ncbi:DUF6301 family protein [Phycicoccus avicenniae]|uniref:DUF6301 family protein n=1 Tax=Phycicoccus avicenniae TaxID=2828860 RepID=UPI003D2B421A
MGTMTWRAIAPEETLRILTVIDALPWPLSKADAKQHLVGRLGWTLNDEGFMRNHAAGLNWPNVSVNASPSGTSDVGFNISDLEREHHDSPEWLAWRDDHFTLTVRHLAQAWGPYRMMDEDSDYPQARWDLPSGGRVNIVKYRKSLKAGYVTPHMAAIERRRGY